MKHPPLGFDKTINILQCWNYQKRRNAVDQVYNELISALPLFYDSVSRRWRQQTCHKQKSSLKLDIFEFFERRLRLLNSNISFCLWFYLQPGILRSSHVSLSPSTSKIIRFQSLRCLLLRYLAILKYRLVE